MIITMKTIPIDKAGRVVLPKEVRRRMHLQAGDRMEASIGAEGLILKPVRATPARLVREDGRVFRDSAGGRAELADFEESLGRGREERDSRVKGIQEL